MQQNFVSLKGCNFSPLGDCKCCSYHFYLFLLFGRHKKCAQTLKNYKFNILRGIKDSILFVIFNKICTFAPANLWPLPE